MIIFLSVGISICLSILPFDLHILLGGGDVKVCLVSKPKIVKD